MTTIIKVARDANWASEHTNFTIIQSGKQFSLQKTAKSKVSKRYLTNNVKAPIA